MFNLCESLGKLPHEINNDKDDCWDIEFMMEVLRVRVEKENAELKRRRQ